MSVSHQHILLYEKELNEKFDVHIRESIQQFLPKYISPQDQKELLQFLNDFPDNLDSRFYTSY